MTLKILTWNTAGRTKRIPDQWEYLKMKDADIVCLQEIQQGGDLIWRDHLNSHYPYIVSSVSFVKNRSKTGPRKYHLIIASKQEIELDRNSSEYVPWVERLLVVNLTRFNLKIATTHIPPGGNNGWVKIEFFEGLYKMLEARPTILTGDFNSPRHEFEDGTLVTWGQRINSKGEITLRKRIHGQDGIRWHEGELKLLKGIRQINYKDMYRDKHGYDLAYSWLTGKNKDIKYRFDHIIGPSEIEVLSATYDNKSMRSLSDHSIFSFVMRV